MVTETCNKALDHRVAVRILASLVKNTCLKSVGEIVKRVGWID